MGKGMTLHVFLESSCTRLNIYCISLLHICTFLGSSAVVFHNVYCISVLRTFLGTSGSCCNANNSAFGRVLHDSFVYTGYNRVVASKVFDLTRWNECLLYSVGYVLYIEVLYRSLGS